MTDCPLFNLPSNQCSHCTGSEMKVEEPFYERGQVILTRQERDEEEDRDEVSNSTVAELYRQAHPGKWAKPQDVYGGHDTQIDFENVELE